MSQSELEEYILKLVRGKLSDGQLNNSPLTLHDIDAICESCAIVLKGVNHERVAYPTDQKNKRPIWNMRPIRTKTANKPEEKETKQPQEAPAPVKPAPRPKKSVVPMTTGENLIIQPEPAAAPITVDAILDGTETPREERPEEVELPPAYIGRKESEPEMPDTAAETPIVDQEGDGA